MKRGFTLIELAMVVVIFALLGALMSPLMKQRWNASGLDESLNNVRQQLVACGEYRLDHQERVPMRGCEYSNGQITGGWDSWNYAGKNCDIYWSGGPFDEHAYWRFLNPYLQTRTPPVPTGWINNGSGSNWTLERGQLTPAQRAAFAVKACRSPGDISTRQRSWPSPTEGISGYDDVGTSYMLNMKWWSQPGPAPSGFTPRFNAGCEGIRRLPSTRWYRPSSDYVWIHDQIADVVANSAGTNTQGEFGGNNRSVLGYLDGRSAYVEVKPGALFGPGYTFTFPWP